MTPQELENSILQLAIQGKLVEQQPDEGTAEELYRQIQEEKRRLVKERKIKKEKPLPEIGEDEIPFEIPESWMWVYIGDIFLHNTGKAQNSLGATNGTIRKFITTSNLYWNSFDFSRVKEMPFTEQELKRCTVKKGDLLVCEGGDCGRSAIWTYDEEVCIQNYVHRLRPYKEISIEYFYYLFYLYKFTGKLRGRGVAIQGLSNEVIHRVICPLPTLAEQKRIVAKIEELLPYIDLYEQAWNRLENFNKRFPIDMQKSLLQWAIQGKLVEQRPEEGTAEELYRQIQEEKQRLVKEGKIKKGKPLPEIAEEEVPFEIPGSWKWVRLGTIISISSGDGLTSKEMDENGMYPVYGGNGVIGHHNAYNITKRTLVIGRVGYYCGSTHITEGKAWVTDNAFVTTFDEDRINMKWLKCYIDYLNPRKKASSTAQPVISGKLIYPMLVPLPPLVEQKRIVAKLEELLALCDRLK